MRALALPIQILSRESGGAPTSATQRKGSVPFAGNINKRRTFIDMGRFFNEIWTQISQGFLGLFWHTRIKGFLLYVFTPEFTVRAHCSKENINTPHPIQYTTKKGTTLATTTYPKRVVILWSRDAHRVNHMISIICFR